MSHNDNTKIFKGIALFTPGGDLIYCIDYHKKRRWHLHLCAALQQILELPEPPHFLVPLYTATIDKCFDSNLQQILTFAEVYPPVQKHQALLNAIFQTADLSWEIAELPDEFSDPFVIETYRQQFPQLWEDHDLIIRFADTGFPSNFNIQTTPGYVFRLFVSGNNNNTTLTLQTLHQLLDKSHLHPYTLKVIDVLKHPEDAERNQITATPTLVRVWPLPIRRLVGDFNDLDKVLNLLILPEE